jgi:hypothetical protein
MHRTRRFPHARIKTAKQESAVDALTAAMRKPPVVSLKAWEACVPRDAREGKGPDAGSRRPACVNSEMSRVG